MARNSKWPENIFYGQRGANMARFEKSGHQMANLATLERYVLLFSLGPVLKAPHILASGQTCLTGKNAVPVRLNPGGQDDENNGLACVA